MVEFTPYIDGDVVNQDSNYDEKFWLEVSQQASEDEAYVTVKTKKTGFSVCTGMRYEVLKDGELQKVLPEFIIKSKYAANRFHVYVAENETLTFINMLLLFLHSIMKKKI